MSTLPITSAFNDGLIDEAYESYRRDPGSVDESWRQFFRVAERLAGATGAPAADAAFLRKVAGAASLAQAIRGYGHFAARIDPLGSPPLGAAELTPAFHGIVEADLATIPGAALGFEQPTAADGMAWLRDLYTSHIGFEFEHIEEEAEREWFRRVIEHGEMRRTLTAEEKIAVLRRLTEVDGLERFLGRAYQGHKRFSIEGTDAMVPMIDVAIESAAAAGARQVVIGMAHRGRINVLAHILDKPYATIFSEFEGKHAMGNAASGTGDVKYHLGAEAERTLPSGERLGVRLLPNPSHLEIVNPVLAGLARALQRLPDATPDAVARDERQVLPILIHGDAAFPGEGVVAETLNLAGLEGYRTGGTLHIIANNQVGFTTNPREGRSTYYASDLAKGFDVPILHVNADDAEACVTAVMMAIAYRERFARDFLIDLVGYRRHGHNETDEPAFTQPRLYSIVRQHPTAREVWGARLVEEGILTAEDVKAVDSEIQSRFEEIHAELTSGRVHPPQYLPGDISEAPPVPDCDTSVPADRLLGINEHLLAWPADFKPMPKLARQFERRRSTINDAIDWGHAEALAWGSLLAEGYSVRISGQDVERGTFSHRQAVLHDHETGRTYTPLQHIPSAAGTFEIYNSPLSETAVMAFEYGYSVAAADSLVLWEAQFGDFVNVGQPVIDQYLTADRAKWGQDSGVVLLLPHGYEGQGPEHSSARLERFLQLCAEGNLRVAYPSTPAQYFHILRRQMLCVDRRPLILMQPKSLLRLPAAASPLTDLTERRFRRVLDDAAASQHPDRVRRLVFCTGKIYYDLLAREPGEHIAIVRVEELYPWPHADLTVVLDSYPSVEEAVWVQEEPRNMGAWSFVAPRLRGAVGNEMSLRYIGRPERASPAEGFKADHDEMQARIVADVLEAMPKPAGEKKRAARATK